jgi:transposase
LRCAASRQVRDVLRLKAAGVSGDEIAHRVGVASSTVRLTLKRLAVAELSWPLTAELTDEALEAQLFTAVGKKQGYRRRAEPDWAAVHRELKVKPSVKSACRRSRIEAMMGGWQRKQTGCPLTA